MREFFLDTNVIFDYLGRREPNGAAAVALFQVAYEGKAALYVASLSFSHTFYTLRKQVGAVAAREALQKLARLVWVLAVDAAVVQQALDSDFVDVEDTMQYFAAASLLSVEAIVTGDPKGLKAGSLAILSPAEVQARLGAAICTFAAMDPAAITAYSELNPQVHFGKPVVQSTRTTVAEVLEMLANGMSAADIAEEFSALGAAQVRACLLYAW